MKNAINQNPDVQKAIARLTEKELSVARADAQTRRDSFIDKSREGVPPGEFRLPRPADSAPSIPIDYSLAFSRAKLSPAVEREIRKLALAVDHGFASLRAIGAQRRRISERKSGIASEADALAPRVAISVAAQDKALELEERRLDLSILACELDAEESAIQAWHQPTGRLQDRIFSFLGVGSITSIIADYESGAGSVNISPIYFGDRRRSGLDKVQSKIDGLIAQRSLIERSRPTRSEIELRIAQQIRSSASGLRQAALDQANLVPKWQRIDSNVPLSLGDLSWLYGQQTVVATLVDRVLAEEGDRNEISLQEASTSLRDNAAEMFSLEQQEEREVLSLAREGFFAVRRETAGAAAILSVWSEL